MEIRPEDSGTYQAARELRKSFKKGEITPEEWIDGMTILENEMDSTWATFDGWTMRELEKD